MHLGFSSPFVLVLQLLEYVGKGKSIIDVGLAQARRSLSTRSHYFEVEIVDPGEKCYIALGLARKVGLFISGHYLSHLAACVDCSFCLK